LSKEEDFAVKFQNEVQPGILARTDYQFETVIPEGAEDSERGVDLVDLLERAGLLRGDAEKEFVSKYLGYQFQNVDKGSYVPYYSLRPGDRVRMTNGVIELERDLGPNVDRTAVVSTTSTLQLFPWDYTLDAETKSQLSSLVAVSKPTCLESKNWNWDRPSNDRFDAERDLDFRFQDGTQIDHRYLAELAKILPANWNLAAMPDLESGLAMQIMFDQCCDMTPDTWFDAFKNAYDLSESDIIVSGSRGGFVVLTARGDYGFEPGKQGHSFWRSSTVAPTSGGEAVAAEVSLFDQNPENDYMPRVGKTRSTVVRRGNITGNEPYWTETDFNEAPKDNDWCDNTAPAGLAAIQYLVGESPFWVTEGYSGGFKTFEGSDQLELVDAKATEAGDKIYQVRFK
jgi:hypothetical protein